MPQIDPDSYDQGFLDALNELIYWPHPNLPGYSLGYRDGEVDLFAAQAKLEFGEWPTPEEEDGWRMMVEAVIRCQDFDGELPQQ